MRVTAKELMNKLGVGYVLGAYETMPWSYYDEETGTSYMAEIRMSPGDDEIEGEIQIMYDDPPENKPPMEQISFIKAGIVHDGLWSLTELKIRGEPFGADIYNWEEKACDFFSRIAQALQHEEVPDFDDLIEDCFHSRERFSDQDGGGGKKAPKIQANKLLNPKGRGF